MADDLKKNPTWLPVVAAAILDEEGCLLMQRRPVHKHHGGLWEFPGGKVESGESPAEALIREIAEELDLHLDGTTLEPLAFAQDAGGGGRPEIVILLYTARSWRGEPKALEGGEWGWFTLERARKLPMPPLDIALFSNIAWKLGA